ncbi:MAG: hypothetical protein LBQ61_04730 [Spirochaetales bacterium]|jgi:hypothetical protein|nr:hypothetical protein [Spirochaetales bacterium]
MKISELEKKLPVTSLQGEYEDSEIRGAYTSDLLSDVMAHAPDSSVLVTIQGHKNTVAVAALADIKVILLCNNRTPEDGMIAAARDEGIAVFVTPENQFKISCLLGAALQE